MKTRYHKKMINALEKIPFQVIPWELFDYSILKYITIRQRSGMSKKTYADLIMMADTETSRKVETPIWPHERHNHVCAWMIGLRAYHRNIAVLWGKLPSELPECLERIRKELHCDEVYLYWHNMPYDWMFTRKFLMKKFGEPKKQLNVKPLYPLQIRFENGIVMKDSLMLSQRSLAKWGEDLHVEHAKAVGLWDYDEIRNQQSWIPTANELTYMSNDVLCGIECIDKTMEGTGKTLGSLPLTATGIVRSEARLEGKKHRAYEWATAILPEDYAEIQIQEALFHGGYTHGNRFANGHVFPGDLTDPKMSVISECFDFASSYPYIMITEKMPSERFWKLKRETVKMEYIFHNMEEYAFIFKLRVKKLKMRNKRFPMPPMPSSKCLLCINGIEDNGKLIAADYAEIWANEIDLALYNDIYDLTDDNVTIEEIRCSKKDYLPKWLRDYVFKRFELKTQLKGVDAVLYAIEKAKLNSLFGMSAQKCVKEDIIELYDTGEYKLITDTDKEFDFEKEYQKYRNNRNTFLPYCIGIWVTSAAQRNLFTLGNCVPESEIWLYSDTDSVYATGFDKRLVNLYNKNCIRKLAKAGYPDPVHFDGKDYYLGVAEPDGRYTQFKALHAKCYCKRPLVAEGEGFVMGDSLKITVAGVPKKGAVTLQNKIENFRIGTLFPGKESGKLQHTHFFVPDIYIDDNGNETGDSIELAPGDYIIKDENDYDFELEKLFEEEVSIIDYEAEV